MMNHDEIRLIRHLYKEKILLVSARKLKNKIQPQIINKTNET